jgi:hypothetical protein
MIRIILGIAILFIVPFLVINTNIFTAAALLIAGAAAGIFLMIKGMSNNSRKDKQIIAVYTIER